MRTYIGAFLVSVIVTVLVTPLVKWFAVRLGAVDVPGGRKVHRVTTPRMGGLAIVVGIAAALSSIVVLDNRVAQIMLALGWRLAGPLLATGLILALGIYDDCHGANAAIKFPIQIAAALIVWFSGVQVEQISNPFGENLQLGIFGLPFVVLWIVTLTNAVNLIDGIDGLAAGVVAIASGALFFIAVHNDNVPMAFFCACVAGASAGFLRYNFPPAQVFMGDTGSLTLGFIFGWLSILASYKGPAVAALLVPALALGLPLADVASAVLRRIAVGAPVFKPDRDHIHHIVLGRSVSHRAATLSLYAVGLALALAAMALTYVRSPRMAAALLIFCTTLLATLGRDTLRRAWSRVLKIDADLHHVTGNAVERVNASGSLEDVGEALRSLAEALDCSRGRLEIFRGEELAFECHWGIEESQDVPGWPQMISWGSDGGRFKAVLMFDVSHLPPGEAGRASFSAGTVLEYVGKALPRIIGGPE